MNRDQAKGHAKGMAGKLQQTAGKLTGSKKQQAKGAAKRVAGAAQKAVGDVKGAASKAQRQQDRTATR